jgi:hypothetical protein
MPDVVRESELTRPEWDVVATRSASLPSKTGADGLSRQERESLQHKKGARYQKREQVRFKGAGRNRVEKRGAGWSMR